MFFYARRCLWIVLFHSAVALAQPVPSSLHDCETYLTSLDDGRARVLAWMRAHGTQLQKTAGNEFVAEEQKRIGAALSARDEIALRVEMQMPEFFQFFNGGYYPHALALVLKSKGVVDTPGIARFLEAFRRLSDSEKRSIVLSVTDQLIRMHDVSVLDRDDGGQALFAQFKATEAPTRVFGFEAVPETVYAVFLRKWAEYVPIHFEPIDNFVERSLESASQELVRLLGATLEALPKEGDLPVASLEAGMGQYLKDSTPSFVNAFAVRYRLKLDSGQLEWLLDSHKLSPEVAVLVRSALFVKKMAQSVETPAGAITSASVGLFMTGLAKDGGAIDQLSAVAPHATAAFALSFLREFASREAGVHDAERSEDVACVGCRRGDPRWELERFRELAKLVEIAASGASAGPLPSEAIEIANQIIALNRAFRDQVNDEVSKKFQVPDQSHLVISKSESDAKVFYKKPFVVDVMSQNASLAQEMSSTVDHPAHKVFLRMFAIVVDSIRYRNAEGGTYSDFTPEGALSAFKTSSGMMNKLVQHFSKEENQ